MTTTLPLQMFNWSWGTDCTAIVSDSILTAKIVGGIEYTVGTAPGNVLYFTTITLQNVAASSQYWIAQTSNLSNVLATGTQGGSVVNIVITNVPAISYTETITIRVREYGGSKYLPFETNAVLSRTGVTVFVSQVTDSIGA